MRRRKRHILPPDDRLATRIEGLERIRDAAYAVAAQSLELPQGGGLVAVPRSLLAGLIWELDSAEGAGR